MSNALYFQNDTMVFSFLLQKICINFKDVAACVSQLYAVGNEALNDLMLLAKTLSGGDGL